MATILLEYMWGPNDGGREEISSAKLAVGWDIMRRWKRGYYVSKGPWKSSQRRVKVWWQYEEPLRSPAKA